MPILKGKRAIAGALNVARKSRKYAEGGAAFGTQSPAEEAENPSPVYQSIGDMVTALPRNAYGVMKNMVQGSRDAMQGEGGAEDGHIVNPQSIQGAGDLIHQGVNSTAGVRPVGNTAGIFLGPYGALRLRNEAREAGNYTKPHPVVGEEIAAKAEAMRPEYRDIYKGQVQDMRDAEALSTLQARQAQGDAYDRDVFARSGWTRGAEGLPKKEIPDTGVKLVESGMLDHNGGMMYRLDHPHGDLHKAYDLPFIRFDPGIKKGMGYTASSKAGKTTEIVMGGAPTKTNLKEAVDVALHEMQHGIQFSEGFATGTNQRAINTASPHFNQEYFPGEGRKELPFQEAANNAAKKSGPMVDEPSLAKAKAKFQAYWNSAGETEARNVMTRRAKSYNYLKHPEDTEDVTRGLQWVDSIKPRPEQEVLAAIRSHYQKQSPESLTGAAKYAGGGGVTNFNPERGAAFGLAKQGMIKSDVPGRTDKLNMNVPSGSYIIPADIPSAIGQGNSMAGGNILDKMFNKGPYGMNIGRAKAGSRVGPRKASLMKMKGFAEGGDTGEATPIVAAGGEYTVHPETVASLGNGDIELGHSILDSFVKQVRAKHISTLRGLKPPKGS